MKRARLRIGDRQFGKTDFPRSNEPWYTLNRLPADCSAFEAPADRELTERLATAPPSQTASLRVHVDGFDVTFQSWRRFRYLIWVFGQPNLPRGHRLTGTESYGTGGNRHWLSRLPAHMKPWAFRRRVVTFLTGDDPQIRRYIRWHLDQGATSPTILLTKS